MRDYNFIKDQFISKHTINNYEYLEKYIKLLLDYKIEECGEYTEMHHILPRSVFPEFEKEDWNIIELKYMDHINAHLYLFKSINIRKYQRTLNFMIPKYKDSELISNAAKIGWLNLKGDEEKYKKWRNSRSNHMKLLSSNEQQRRAKLFWDNMTKEQYELFSSKMKGYWTDEKREEKSKQMNEHYSNQENIEKKRIEGQKRWNNMSIEERENFKLTMNTVNKDVEKRKVAGEKIKNLWTNIDYLEKMRNRPHNPGKKIKIIKQDGEEIIVENMRKFEKEYNFSSHLIRKYRDKDIYINEKDLKENKFLLNCKIESL